MLVCDVSAQLPTDRILGLVCDGILQSQRFRRRSDDPSPGHRKLSGQRRSTPGGSCPMCRFGSPRAARDGASPMCRSCRSFALSGHATETWRTRSRSPATPSRILISSSCIRHRGVTFWRASITNIFDKAYIGFINNGYFQQSSAAGAIYYPGAPRTVGGRSSSEPRGRKALLRSVAAEGSKRPTINRECPIRTRRRPARSASRPYEPDSSSGLLHGGSLG